MIVLCPEVRKSHSSSYFLCSCFLRFFQHTVLLDIDNFEINLFNLEISQLPLQVRVDLGVMGTKGYSPNLQIQFIVKIRTFHFFLGGGGGFLLLCRECSQHILSPADREDTFTKMELSSMSYHDKFFGKKKKKKFLWYHNPHYTTNQNLWNYFF